MSAHAHGFLHFLKFAESFSKAEKRNSGKVFFSGMDTRKGMLGI